MFDVVILGTAGSHPKPGLADDPAIAAVIEKQQLKPSRPRRFKVLLHNDDYTTMEFVVMILKTIFYHSDAMAIQIMLTIHRQGVALAGTFTREIAEAKCAKVYMLARKSEFPLRCSMEVE